MSIIFEINQTDVKIKLVIKGLKSQVLFGIF